MAKVGNGMFGGGSGTPFNPQQGGGMFQRGQGGILPERGSDLQRELVMSALQSAMGSAQNSGSPLLAFLAPLAGGAIGSRTEGLHEKGQDKRRGASIDRLMAAMGGGGQGAGGLASAMGGAGSNGPARGPAQAAPDLNLPGGGVDSSRLSDTVLGFGAGVPGTNSQRPPVEPMDMSGRVLSGLMERGMPRHIAEAFVMNFKDESALNPGINEANPIVPGSRGGFGLAQWTGPRRRELEAFAASSGRPLDDVDMQLDFLMTELEGSESSAAREIFSSKDAGTAAAAITRKFLRPLGKHADRRVARYTSGQGPSAGGGTGGGLSAAMNGGGSAPNRDLLELMTDPSIPEEVRGVAASLFERQMGQGSPVNGINVGGSLVNPQTGEVLFQAPEDRSVVEGADGFKYYQDTGERVLPNVEVGQKSNADTSRQVNIAASALAERIDNLQTQFNPATGDFFTREEAIEATRVDPLYSRQWNIIQDSGAMDQGGSPGSITPPNQPPPQPSMPSAPTIPSMGANPDDEALLKKYGVN